MSEKNLRGAAAKACEKLRGEAEAAKGLSRYASAVKSYVTDALCSFCEQKEEFSRAVLDSDKNIKDCLEEIMKNCGNSISDFEVYRRACAFYFPGSTIRFRMEILMSRYDGEEDRAEQRGGVSLDLDELL